MQTDAEFKATVKDLASTHGKVVSESETQIVCRKPTYAELNAFTTKVDSSKLDACRDLVISTAVYPERDELKARYQELPGVLIPLATAVAGLGGVSLEIDILKS